MFFTAAAGCLILAARMGWAAPEASPERDIRTLEKRFRELPTEARQWTGPLFWLHGDESKERLEMYVGKVAEGGNGSFTTESRPHKDWLGEGWYRDLGICLDSAKKHGLKMWIFDEKWFPSGEVGGNVPARYGAKRMAATGKSVTGPARFTAENCGGPNFIAAVAGKEGREGIDGDSLLDLAGSIRDGKLAWEVPAGQWRVMVFSWSAHKSGQRYIVDGASQDCVDWYLRTVYQPHYDRFKDDFGKTIAGFFYDEPETPGDWGTEVMKVLAERRVDWKRALVAWKFKLAGEEQAAAWYQYQEAYAEALGRTFYGGVTRWCHEHGVRSIGHYIEHGFMYLSPEYCARNMFPLLKYSDMGGIDAVIHQFIWGQRAKVPDAPTWITPKMASSISHAYGKPEDLAMVEIFGARGQDLTYPEMKWWTDHMQVSGVNCIIPHSFNPKAPRDMDCPPYFYNGGFEPRWPLYRVYADYTSRLSTMLTGGRHAAPVALLFLGGSAHVGKRVLPEQITEALQDALYDCDLIPYEVFENDMARAGRELKLREESYRILMVPPAEVIPYATLAGAKEFFENGGIVVGYGFLPSKSCTLGRTSAEIAALREAVWGVAQPGLEVCKTNAAGGRSYLLPEKPTPEQLEQVFAGDAGIHPTLDVLEGKTDRWLHVLHRVKAGHDVFFIVNQNHLAGAKRLRLRITADGVPECWDAMRNEIAAVPHVRKGREVELTLEMEPNGSALLVFQKASRLLPALLQAGAKSLDMVPVAREDVPPPPEPKLEGESVFSAMFKGSSWVWYPEGNPSQSAAPGTCYFRKQFTARAGKIARAVFTATADNGFTLFVNGKEAGHGDLGNEGWRRPVDVDVRSLLRPGVNQLAVAGVNTMTTPTPAGLLGCLRIEFEHGEPLMIHVDGTWKVSRQEVANWTALGTDDSSWPLAKEVARFGDPPWGTLAEGGVTLSPVKANPFIGHCRIPDGLSLGTARVYLETEGLSPELAARVTVNGRDAGGFIGAPARLEVSPYLKAGWNAIRIEPFSPKTARLVVYAR